MHSIVWRITGLMFLAILATVLVLVFLANHQMAMAFQDYLAIQHLPSSYVAGVPERVFMESIHHSLYWVGGVILLAGLLASYLLATSITVPLRKLSTAVEAIRHRQYGQTVDIASRDEVGRLALAFNDMSKSLERSIELRQRFSADIAHELNTPLAIIRGNLEGMLEGVVERGDEQLNSLYEETVHLNRMIRDLRDLTMAEAGQLALEKAPTDINLLINRAVSMLEPAAEEKSINLVKDLQSVPWLNVDAGRINQILYNLLTNALRYTPLGGTMTIATGLAWRQDAQGLQITVSDTGTGIADEDLPHIFEHFFRGDKSRDKRSGGSGIGLAIVKQLTEVHGGFVEAASTPGEGSKFIIWLPLEK
jgi:two-component system, OmpR family, sensor histidine kinase BaeS